MLIRAYLCSQAEERKEYGGHNLGVQRVPAVAKACGKLLQSEVGHAFPQVSWPQTVGPSSEPSCIGSQEGVGSNQCLLTAWW